MNESHLNDDVYSVVKLDGEECNDVKLETIKEWYFNKQINDSSLIFAERIGKWQILKNLLNVDELKVEYVKRTSPNTIHQYQVSNETDSPVQFDPNTQYNQTTEKQYNQFEQQNTEKQAYIEQPVNQNSYNPQFSSTQVYQQQSVISQPIQAYRVASAFLLTNFAFWIISTCISIFFGLDQTSKDSGEDFAYKFGQEIGSHLIRLIIDLSIAASLSNALNTDIKARLFAIVRTYFGTIVYIVIIIPFFAEGYYFAGVTSLASTMFYAIGLLVLLHGKSVPNKSRVLFGYLFYFLFIAATILSLYSLLPLLSKANVQNSVTQESQQNEVNSLEFSDPSVGVNLKLPQGWKQFEPDDSSKANGTQMTGKHSNGKRGVSLVINKFTKERPLVVLKSIALSKVVENVESSVQKMDKTFKSLSVTGVKIGDMVGKRIIYEGTNPDTSNKIKGHIILAVDNDAIYVITMYSLINDYDKAINEFIYIESNFNVAVKD